MGVFNRIILFLNALVMVIILMLVASALLNGCAHPAPVPTPATNVVKLECAYPEITALTFDQWTDQDELAMQTAIATCDRDYGPEHPCLVKFTRVKHGQYRAICGERK